MPNVKLSPHPSGVTIAFEDERHIYYVDETNGPTVESVFGKTHHITKNIKKDWRFTSGTAFVGKAFPKFDKHSVSFKYAKKHGLNQQDVLDDWADRGLIARTEGTMTHDFAEQIILGNNVAVIDENENKRVHNMQKQALKAIEYLSRMYILAEPEKVLASLDLKIAGMLDLLAINKKTGQKTIFDWKTNKEIKMKNIWQNAFPPISYLQDTNYNHYCLQLNLYEYIGKHDGYFKKSEPMDKTLIHLTEDDFQLIPCFDMQDEIEKMF